MENLAKAYEALFMLTQSNIKKALSFAKAIPKEKIYPDLLIGYMKSDNDNVRSIAEQLIMQSRTYNIDYKYLAEAITTNNEEVTRVILLLARRIEKHRLSIKDLKKLTLSKVYNVRQLAFTLLIKNFADELSLDWLIKCQEIDDSELGSGARDIATNKGINVNPLNLFKLLDTKVEKVRNFVKTICLMFSKEDYDYEKLNRIAKGSKDPDASDLAYLIIVRKFSDLLTYEELESYRYFRNEAVRVLVPKVLMERFPEKLDFEDYLSFQSSPFESVQSKASVLAYSYSIDNLNADSLTKYQDTLLRYVNLEDKLTRNLAIALLMKIPVDKLDYQLLLGWCSKERKHSYEIASSLLRNIPVDIFDPEVVAIFLNSHNEGILKMATELALKIPSDYSKETDEFVKNHFND